MTPYRNFPSRVFNAFVCYIYKRGYAIEKLEQIGLLHTHKIDILSSNTEPICLSC
jgi:hypothetical protein